MYLVSVNRFYIYFRKIINNFGCINKQVIILISISTLDGGNENSRI